jgi:hypothetical protein
MGQRGQSCRKTHSGEGQGEWAEEGYSPFDQVNAKPRAMTMLCSRDVCP